MNGLLLALEWLLAVLYLLSGINDLFLDLVFYIERLRDHVRELETLENSRMMRRGRAMWVQRRLVPC